MKYVLAALWDNLSHAVMNVSGNIIIYKISYSFFPLKQQDLPPSSGPSIPRELLEQTHQFLRGALANPA